MYKKLNVFISGQKYFGDLILSMCIREGHNIVGVCCPIGDRYIGKTAQVHNIPIIPAGMLSYDTMPEGVDVGITAHSFDYIGKLTRYKPKIGWIGYHPSLLPRHRGRSSIEWALKMRDFATGGTVFWLNAGIDRGDILMQETVFIDPALFQLSTRQGAKVLWENDLQDIGVRLLRDSLQLIEAGDIRRKPQNNKFSTFEPSLDIKDIYKPDLLMIKQVN